MIRIEVLSVIREKYVQTLQGRGVLATHSSYHALSYWLKFKRVKV